MSICTVNCTVQNTISDMVTEFGGKLLGNDEITSLAIVIRAYIARNATIVS